MSRKLEVNSLIPIELILAMPVYFPIWHSHCTRGSFTVLLSCRDELLTVRACPLICLQRQVAKFENKLFYCCNLSGGVALIVCFTTNGMCAKNKNIYAWREQAIVREIASSVVACCHGAKLCAHAVFRSPFFGLSCVKITWQQIFKDSLQVTARVTWS